jgi:hypothetical protein
MLVLRANNLHKFRVESTLRELQMLVKASIEEVHILMIQ